MSDRVMDIALKAPHGTNTLVYSDGSWEHMPDINAWIASKLDPSFQNFMISNDECPSGRETSCGHLKHVVAAGQDSFVVLCHSVPKWPVGYPPERIPDAELIYGQSFFKLSLPIAQLPGMLERLAVCDPNAYVVRGIPYAPRAHFPVDITFVDVLPSVCHVVKSHRWNRDLFADGIVPHCASGVRVESWLRPMNFVADDGVVDVDAIRWPNSVSYHSRQDHSKWCVTDDGLCVWIGSINHMHSQRKRGGDGYIIRDARLNHAFSTLIWTDPNVAFDHVHIPAHLSGGGQKISHI